MAEYLGMSLNESSFKLSKVDKTWTKKTSISLNNIDTDIISIDFSDRLFIIISQLGKMGSMLKAWAQDRVFNEGEESKIYHVNVLMGKRDDPLLSVYARQIIERVSKTNAKPVLLGISLKEEGRSSEQFQFILNNLFELIEK